MVRSLRQRLKDSRQSRMMAEVESANLRAALITVSKLVPRRWLTFTSRRKLEKYEEALLSLQQRSGQAFLDEVLGMERRLKELAKFADGVRSIAALGPDVDCTEKMALVDDALDALHKSMGVG